MPLDEAFAVAVHPRLDVLYAVSATPPTLSTYAIAPATGALTRTASVGLTSAFALTLSRDGGTLYVSDSGQLATFAVDPVTGALRRQATTPLVSGNDNYELRVDAPGRFLYAQVQGEVAVFERAASGALTPVHAVPFGNLGGQLAIAP